MRRADESVKPRHDLGLGWAYSSGVVCSDEKKLPLRGRAMLRISGRIIGVVLALLGAIWTLQGFNILAGSRMSGDSFWAGAGLVALVGGLVILALSLRAAPSQT